MADAERLHAETPQEWRDWLDTHHARRSGVWLVSWKTATGRPRMSYDESVEEALCFGWLDSRSGTLDGERGVRRAILEWIVQARRPGTRLKRITETAERAARGERANQWRRD